MSTIIPTPEVLASLSPAVLAAAMAAASEREAIEAAASDAAAIITRTVREAIEGAAGLAAAAAAAGLEAPDMAGLMAAAMTRVAPASPETLAAVIAPEPAAAPASTGKRQRASVVRDWNAIPKGADWTFTWGAYGSGKIRITPKGDGAMFTIREGQNSGMTFSSATRAVQYACGNPTTEAPSVKARKDSKATVNGMIVLMRDDRTLDDWTRAKV